MFKKKLDLLKASSENRLKYNFLFQMEKNLKTFGMCELAPILMDEQLKKDIWSIWKILINCQENLAFSRYFYNSATEDERSYINSSREFRFIRLSLWKLGIIEIHKILSLSKNDAYSLWRLMINIESEKYFNHGISSELILGWKIKLKSVKETVKKISLLRNQMYAHTDPDAETIEAEITFEEIDVVLKVIESVIKDVYLHAFDSTIGNKTIIFQKGRFDMIKILAQKRNERKNELIELAKKLKE